MTNHNPNRLHAADLLVQRNGLVWSRRQMQRIGSVIGPAGEWRARCKCGDDLGVTQTRGAALDRLLEHLNGDEPSDG